MPLKRYTITTSIRARMIQDKKLLTLVITFSTIAILLLATSILVIGFNLLLIGNLLPAAMTSGYLYTAWKKQHHHSSVSRNSQQGFIRHKSQGIKIPFVVVAILILPLIITIVLSLMYSYPIYLVVASIMLPWTFT